MIISNTEITSKNTCDKQHDYMYNQNLEPRKYSIAISRGVAGHSVLEVYYKNRQEGYSHEESVDFAMSKLYELISKADPDDTEYMQMMGHLSWLLLQYFDYYKDDTYRIISVESVYTAPMTEEIQFGLYLDILAEITTGEYRGYVDIIDTKFVNNFKTIDDLRLDAQQPKYAKVAKLNGLPLRHAIFNQIRYRKMKSPRSEDLFRRSPLLLSSKAINTVWEEATETAVELHQEKITGFQTTRRRQSYTACKNCFFKDLCMTELAGQDTTIMRNTQYQQRERPLKDWMLNSV